MGHQTNLRPRFKKLPATGGPTVTFPPSPSPQLPRAAPPPPPPPSAGPGRARGAGSAAAASDPSSRGRGGRAQTGSEEGIRGAGVTWGPSPAGDLGEEGRARTPSQRGCGNVGSGQFLRCPRPATGAARPRTKIKRPTPGPSAPSLAARYAASRARPAPTQDFIGGPGAPGSAHRPRPPRSSPPHHARG